jgi:hypothetical protein
MSDGVYVVIKENAIPDPIKGWLGKGIDLFECDPLNTPSPKAVKLLSSSVDSLPATNYNESITPSTPAETARGGFKTWVNTQRKFPPFRVNSEWKSTSGAPK